MISSFSIDFDNYQRILSWDIGDLSVEENYLNSFI